VNVWIGGEYSLQERDQVTVQLDGRYLARQDSQVAGQAAQAGAHFQHSLVFRESRRLYHALQSGRVD
jgi:hypothetical protein